MFAAIAPKDNKRWLQRAKLGAAETPFLSSECPAPIFTSSHAVGSKSSPCVHLQPTCPQPPSQEAARQALKPRAQLRQWGRHRVSSACQLTCALWSGIPPASFFPLTPHGCVMVPGFAASSGSCRAQHGRHSPRRGSCGWEAQGCPGKELHATHGTQEDRSRLCWWHLTWATAATEWVLGSPAARHVGLGDSLDLLSHETSLSGFH